jgi:hypothetical protein
MALFEIMTLDDEMREMIMQEASTNILRGTPARSGMRTLRESGCWRSTKARPPSTKLFVRRLRKSKDSASGFSGHRIGPGIGQRSGGDETGHR